MLDEIQKIELVVKATEYVQEMIVKELNNETTDSMLEVFCGISLNLVFYCLINCKPENRRSILDIVLKSTRNTGLDLINRIEKRRG